MNFLKKFEIMNAKLKLLIFNLKLSNVVNPIIVINAE